MYDRGIFDDIPDLTDLIKRSFDFLLRGIGQHSFQDQCRLTTLFPQEWRAHPIDIFAKRGWLRPVYCLQLEYILQRHAKRPGNLEG